MKKFKALAAVILVLSLLTGIICSAAETAASYEPTDSYVIYYEQIGGTYPISEYASPYQCNLTYSHVGNEPYNEVTGIISMYNTYDNREVIPVYCVDEKTGVKSKTYYQRLNLEDSSFYSDDIAAMLRTIVNNCYPTVSLEALSTASGVADLTLGEAIHASQLAIWHTAYGDALSINDFINGIYNWHQNWVRYYEESRAEIESGYAVEENFEYIEERIIKVFNYLVNLEPSEASEKVVSNASFIEWSEAPVLSLNEDGSYNASVNATVDVDVNDGDSLTLTAFYGEGEYYTSTQLTDGVNNAVLTIENVPAEVVKQDLKLAIDGVQQASGVFLFVPDGQRDTAQSMIGIDNSALPVHAEITVGKERIINIEKLGKDQNGNNVPLEGIQFDIHFVADYSDFLSGAVELPAAEKYSYSGYGIYNIITDKNGKGCFNLTKNSMPDGVYLIVERSHPAVVAPVKPFYVIMPATNAAGTDYEYVINIIPKNVVKEEVDIEKDVIKLNNNSATVDAYKDHTWIISATIPSDIENGKLYKISDTLDNRLDYIGNVKVTVESIDGTSVLAELTKDVHYTLTVNDVASTEGEKPSDSFTVELTTAGMKKVASVVDGVSDSRLRVYFDAQINSNAAVDTEIPNKAIINYTNSAGVDFNEESDIPVVYTGAANLLKIDADNEESYLEGAVFEVYKLATEAELADENIAKYEIKGVSGKVIKVEFFDKEGFSDNKVTKATTDKNGKIYIYGLEYGTYYILETKAPAGYNLLTEAKELIIGKDTGLSENAVKVLNKSGAVLPETGGVGTTWFIVIGSVLALAAIIILVTRRRINRGQ